MLDNVILEHYLPYLGETNLGRLTQNKHIAHIAAMRTLNAFRNDLIEAAESIDELRLQFQDNGYTLSHVRILELLVWTETETRGYYRTP